MGLILGLPFTSEVAVSCMIEVEKLQRKQHRLEYCIRAFAPNLEF